METVLTLLGTGGGRHTTMFQARSTGGFLLSDSGKNIHVDPGPGALTSMCSISYDLRKTDAVIVSHCHPDHYSDAESVIEGMTYGGWRKRGAVYGTESVISGKNGLGPCISPYHKSISSKTIMIKEGDVIDVCGIKTEITTAKHSDPCNVGFKFFTNNGIVSYVSDTAYSDDIAKQYIGSRILMLPVTTPDDARIDYHLCTEDAIKFMKIVEPELTIFIHLGIVMLKHNANEQAAISSDATGLPAIAGRDLMKITLNESISIEDIPPKKPDWNDAWNL